MTIQPGSYFIFSVRTEIGIDLYGRYKIESWSHHRCINQQWRVQRFDRGYALKSAQSDLYFGIKDARREIKLEPVCEHDASMWTIERQYEDVYTISIYGSQMYLTLPEGREGNSVPLLLVEKTLKKGQLWKFEWISEDTGGMYRPQNPTSLYFQPQNEPSKSRGVSGTVVSGDSDSPYVDDEHFHTDMLFNLPRIPFTRMQRAVVLEWARKMGMSNVPTLESLDECERRIEAGRGDAISENNSANNMKRERNSSADD